MRCRSSAAAAVSKRSHALRNGPVAAGGLLQSLQILKVVSLTLPLKMAEKFSMSALKCGGGGGEIAITPIFFTKNNAIFFLFGGGDGGQNQLLTILFPTPR